MTACFLVLTPLLRYAGLNRTCPAELSWLLMRATSACRVQQGEFTTALVQPPSSAVKSRSTAHMELSFLHRGRCSRQAGRGCFQMCSGTGRLISPSSFHQEGGLLGSHGRWCSLLLQLSAETMCFCLCIETASFQEVFTQMYIFLRRVP